MTFLNHTIHLESGDANKDSGVQKVSGWLVGIETMTNWHVSHHSGQDFLPMESPAFRLGTLFNVVSGKHTADAGHERRPDVPAFGKKSQTTKCHFLCSFACVEKNNWSKMKKTENRAKLAKTDSCSALPALAWTLF